jgi:hypothetical protein
VHAHVGVSPVPVDHGLDVVAGSRHRFARVHTMQDAAPFTLAGVHDLPFAPVASTQHARVAGLAAAERVEHCTVENDAVRQHFGDARDAAAHVGILLEQGFGPAHVLLRNLVPRLVTVRIVSQRAAGRSSRVGPNLPLAPQNQL